MQEQQANPMGRIWQISEKEHGRLFLSVVYAVLGVLAGIVPYVAAAKIISGIIAGNQDASFYLLMAVLALVGYVLKSVLYALGLSVSHRAAFSVLAEIRKEIIAKLPRMPLGTIIDTSSGKLKQIIVDEVERMERPIAHMIPELTSNIIGAVAVWVYLMAIDWRMGLICLISVPVGMLFFLMIATTYGEDYRQSVETTQAMNASIMEYVNGIEVIKAYNQGATFYQKFKDKVMANAAFYYGWMKKTEFNTAMCYAIAPCTLITVLPLGWKMYLSGSISADVLMTSIMLSMSVVGPIMAAISFTDSSAKVATTVATVDELLSGAEQEHAEEWVTFGSHDIELKDVSYAYHAGEEQVAYVSQDTWLFDDTIMNNLRMGKTTATDEEVREIARRSGCSEFIEALPQGYETPVGSGGTHLSGGERQRLAIARAMLKDAPIVVLDEATAYIDPENEALIQRALAGLVKDKTVVIIAHRLSTITNADQIVLVNDGTVERVGTHQELLETSDLYRSMWQAHISEGGAR